MLTVQPKYSKVDFEESMPLEPGDKPCVPGKIIMLSGDNWLAITEPRIFTATLM